MAKNVHGSPFGCGSSTALWLDAVFASLLAGAFWKWVWVGRCTIGGSDWDVSHYWHHHFDLLVKVASLQLLCCDVTHLCPAPVDSVDSQCSGKGPLKVLIFLCQHELHGSILCTGEYYCYYLFWCSNYLQFGHQEPPQPVCSIFTGALRALNKKLIGTVWFFGLILYFPFCGPGINCFFKDPCFICMENPI